MASGGSSRSRRRERRSGRRHGGMHGRMGSVKMAPTPRIEGRRGSMEARGDVDTARQMGRLEAIRPRCDRDGGGSVVRFRNRSTRRTQSSRHSTSGAELRVDHAPTCQCRRNRHFPCRVLGSSRFVFLFFISDRTIRSADQRRNLCLGWSIHAHRKYNRIIHVLGHCLSGIFMVEKMSPRG